MFWRVGGTELCDFPRAASGGVRRSESVLRGLGLALALAANACFCVATRAAAGSGDDDIQQAEALERDGHFAEALALADARLKKPFEAGEGVLRARWRWIAARGESHVGSAVRSELLADTALADPELPAGARVRVDLLNAKAFALYKQRELDRCISVADEAGRLARTLKLENKYVASRERLATCQLAAKRLDDAVAVLEAAMKDCAAAKLPCDGAKTLLGVGLRRKGETARAISLYREVLAHRRATLKAGHTKLASILTNLGFALRVTGELTEALSCYTEAIGIRGALLPNGRISLARNLHNRAAVFIGIGKNGLAAEDLSRASELRAVAFRYQFVGLKPEQTGAVWDAIRRPSDALLSLHLDRSTSDSTLGRLAALDVMRTKGLATDLDLALRRASGSVEGSSIPPGGAIEPGEEELDGEVEASASDGASSKGAVWEREFDQQPGLRAVGIAPFRFEEVAAALPERAVLLEYVAYRPYVGPGADDARWQPDRYAVYAIARSGLVAWAVLGEKREIDRKVHDFRSALLAVRGASGPRLESIKAETRLASRELWTLILSPVASALGSIDHVIVAPTGQLHLVPFAAMLDERDRPLIERAAVSYVVSGRELLVGRDVAPSTRPPLVVSAPAFGPQGESGRFPPLDDRWGRRVAATFAAPDLLTGADATEVSLRSRAAPAALFFFTHGFASVRAPRPFDHAGLALANANRSLDDAGDGILTASEASTLSLWGCGFVALGACESGLGVIPDGDTMYGVARAFRLAGARSTLSLLWIVDEEASGLALVQVAQGLGRGVERSRLRRRGRGAAPSPRPSRPVAMAPRV
jgi:tetratricopeptide (TPR) repeat protein